MTPYLKALLEERAGYENRGLSQRVREVDIALREIGYDHKYMDQPETATATPDVEKATSLKARRRTVK